MKFFRSIFGKTAAEPVKPTVPVETGPDPVMTALAELEVKRLREALAAASAPVADHEAEAETEADHQSARPNRVVKARSLPADRSAGPAVNIWDMDTHDALKPVAPSGFGSGEPERRRPTRSKTRI